MLRKVKCEVNSVKPKAAGRQICFLEGCSVKNMEDCCQVRKAEIPRTSRDTEGETNQTFHCNSLLFFADGIME